MANMEINITKKEVYITSLKVRVMTCQANLFEKTLNSKKSQYS